MQAVVEHEHCLRSPNACYRIRDNRTYWKCPRPKIRPTFGDEDDDDGGDDGGGAEVVTRGIVVDPYCYPCHRPIAE